MPSVKLSRIRKTFGDTPVLADVSLSIEDGEFVALVGPSGCGKSTLLRILAGLEQADSGTVHIDDVEVTQIRPSARNLAMVFQSYALYPHLTVRDNLLTPLRLRDLGTFERLPVLGRLMAGAKHAAMHDKLRQTADILQIEPLLDRKPGQLSGGQRQRVALGRSMVRNPRAYLMDEPLSNLDAALRVRMRAELSELHRALGGTFLYVTHDQIEALTMSDRVAVMKDGHILSIDSPDRVYDDPECLEVARFIGSPPINLFPGMIEGSGAVRTLNRVVGRSTPQSPESLIIGFRPESIMLTDQGRGIAALVRHREHLGAEMFLHVEIEGHDERIILRTSAMAGLTVGSLIAITFDEEKLLCFRTDGSRLRTPDVRLAEIA